MDSRLSLSSVALNDVRRYSSSSASCLRPSNSGAQLGRRYAIGVEMEGPVTSTQVLKMSRGSSVDGMGLGLG